MVIFKKTKPLRFKRSASFEMMNEFNDTDKKKKNPQLEGSLQKAQIRMIPKVWP